MELMTALMAAHARTSPGWDTEGPADLATWVCDRFDNEVVVFETGNAAQDAANAAFAVMAHQAVPQLQAQISKMANALAGVENVLRDTVFSGENDVVAPSVSDVVAQLIALCREARGAVAEGRSYEYKVNIPQATPDVRAQLSDNYPTKEQAVQAAKRVMEGLPYEKAVIFRIELDEQGHVVQHEVSQFVANPSL